jgi:hypothetical protein
MEPIDGFKKVVLYISHSELTLRESLVKREYSAMISGGQHQNGFEKDKGFFCFFFFRSSPPG